MSVSQIIQDKTMSSKDTVLPEELQKIPENEMKDVIMKEQLEVADKKQENREGKINDETKMQVEEEDSEDAEFEDIRPEDVEPEVIDPTELKQEDIEVGNLGSKNAEAENIKSEEIQQNENDTKPATKYKMIPILEKSQNTHEPSKVAVPRKRPPLSMPALNERPLVLATHLVPSLPISLFEVLIEAIEVATEKPVVLLHEPRTDRPVAKEITDIAVLPASEEWKDGKLLPVTFAFKHHLNKDNSPGIYCDVVVAVDRAPHVETITDLRGHRCALPDRRKRIGATGLLFNYLHSKGEGPAFFGNTLDANSQIAALQMVAGKQAEIGVLEAPVIQCHKHTLPGIESLRILTSLGPLPPYRIMVNKTFPDILVGKITDYLLNVSGDKEWIERLMPFGVTGFVENCTEFYDLCEIKSVVTSVPYY